MHTHTGCNYSISYHGPFLSLIWKPLFWNYFHPNYHFQNLDPSLISNKTVKRCWHFGCPLATASTKFKLNYIGLKDKWKWNSSFCLFFVIFKWTLFGLQCKVDHKHLTDTTNINLVCKIADVKIPSSSRHISTMMVILWLILIDMRIQCVTMLPPSVTIFVLIWKRRGNKSENFFIFKILHWTHCTSPQHTPKANIKQKQHVQVETDNPDDWYFQNWPLPTSGLPTKLPSSTFIYFFCSANNGFISKTCHQV